MDRKLIVVPLVIVALAMPELAAAHAPHAARDIKKCRAQTVTWVKGHKIQLAKGPRDRSGSGGGIQEVTDGGVDATYQKVDLAHFLDVESVYPATQPQRFTRLKSITLYLTNGKKKTFKPTGNPNKDYVYKYDMTKSYGQMQLPVSGTTGQGRPTPKVKKAVVKATEACYATPEPQ